MGHKSSTDDSSNHVEDIEATRVDKQRQQTVKLDPHGLPLLPQPSNFKDDPLVSSYSSIKRKAIIPDTSHPYLG